MPTVLRILFALFAALAVCVAAWAGLCAAGIEKARLAGSASETPPAPQAPPAVAALPRVPATADASAVRASRARGKLEVALRGAASTEPLVLTVFDGWSAAPIASTPVDGKALAAGRVAFDGVPLGAHRVTLARDASGARNGYLTAANAPVGADAARAELDVTVADLQVAVRMSGGSPAADVLIIAERIDDPAWHGPPAREGRTEHFFTDASGHARLGPLGAGRYRVRAPLADAPGVEVEIPATTTATLTLRSAR